MLRCSENMKDCDPDSLTPEQKKDAENAREKLVKSKLINRYSDEDLSIMSDLYFNLDNYFSLRDQVEEDEEKTKVADKRKQSKPPTKFEISLQNTSLVKRLT